MILCCGEALIDMLPRQTSDGENAFAPYAGGAVFNTAIALGRLGAGPGFFCGLSRDLFGDLLVETLEASKVDASLSPRLDRPCTLAIVKLVDGQATYAFYDENTALKAMNEADLPLLPDEISALFFGGISLVGEPCGTAFEALMAREAKTRVTMIDPNVRPGFVTDRRAYVARIDRMMGLADIVKLSDEDLHWLNGDGETSDAARKLIAAGTKLVLITQGAEGVRAFFGSDEIFVPAEQAEVIDTVGAGDTFNAGVLAALQKAGRLEKSKIADLDADTIKAAVAFGAKVAAVTVSRAGANPPWEHEL